ncbi:MAG: GNAT family N-acetyltransferase [Firmicutes bacterium]|nr:GNAT family N-acetyltransferase [Bacillota bacterium]
MYQLVKPTIFYKKKYLDYMKEWNSETITPVISDLRGRRFETLLKELYEFEHETRLPKGYFPDSSYLFVDGKDDIIGFVNIRHYLNDTLLNARGNISYGLRPTHRTDEIAQIVLKLSLEEAKDIGIKRVKVISKKIDIAMSEFIKGLGGTFDSDDYNEIDRYHIQRYWINLG